MGDFLTDVKTLRERARAEIEKGPVTDAYGADRERVIQVLNEALATELVCILRYKRHYYTATGINAEPVAAEFLQHAIEEQDHADRLAMRIVQLGGEPDFNPDTLTMRSHAEYDESHALVDMIREFVESKGAKFLVGLQGTDAALVRHLEEKRIPFVVFDGADAYPGASVGRHWTPEGHKFVADRLMTFFAANGVISPGQTSSTK